MLIAIDHVLTAAQVAQFRAQLDSADWHDGARTAGTLAKTVKRNQQLPDGSELAVRLGRQILQRLAATPLFVSAALPRTMSMRAIVPVSRPCACASSGLR